MKVKKVININSRDQYDITTIVENFYIVVKDVACLVHNSPAIFAGINPDNNKFFVGTKSVFNINPKINYTSKDIDNNHPGSGLNKKLKIALKFLSELDIRDVIQGDMMFTEDDLKVENINGEKCVTFQPNTILYAVPLTSSLARQIQIARLGIVWHTTYKGNKLENMKASFNVNIGRLNQTKNVWFRDADFIDATGAAQFSYKEKEQIQSLLSQIGTVFRQISPGTLNNIAFNDTYRNYILQWHNSKVKSGETTKNINAHVIGLISNIEQQFNSVIAASKLDRTKQRKQIEKRNILSFFRSNMRQLQLMFHLQNLIIEAKDIILSRLQRVKDIGTFLKTDSGFKVTSPEGFVSINSEGKAVKLVDRLEFSKENFNTDKNWNK